MNLTNKVLSVFIIGVTTLFPLATAQAHAAPGPGSRVNPAGSLPQACGTCHNQVRQQWEGSLHARSLEDPLYLAMRSWAIREKGEGMAKLCASCHSVALAAGHGRTSSVDCRACHQGVPAQKGGARLLVDPDTPVLAPRVAEGAPHPLESTSRLASGAVCEPCHAVLKNPRGVTLCSTGLEAGAYPPGPGCVDCHMGPAGHRFEGTSPRLLSQAAAVSLDTAGSVLRTTVLNTGTGHGLPTGSALRQVHLVITFLDAGGRTLASHREVFSRVFADAQGNAPVPPWRAASVARDTRLGRHEVRTFAYTIPNGARRVEARLIFHRAPVRIVHRLGLEDHPSVRPVTMVRVLRSLP